MVGAFYSTPTAANKAGRTEFVLYGSSHGITTAGATTIRSTTAGMPQGTGKNFDMTLQTGDFNADGVTDVAYGEPILKVGTLSQAGAVDVLYGTHSGPRTTGSLMLTSPNGTAIQGGQFGNYLGVLPSSRGAAAGLFVGSSAHSFLFSGGPHGLSMTNVAQLQVPTG